MPTFITIVLAILASAIILAGFWKLGILYYARLKRQRRQRIRIEKRRRTAEAYRRGFCSFVVVESAPLIPRSSDY